MKEVSGGVGMIYYSGHGIQEEGENYLIPADAAIELPGDLERNCVSLNTFFSMANNSPSLHLFIIDACRSNSFPSFSKDVVKGLAPVQGVTGSIVIFATQPGKTASDGDGTNGLFTEKLLKNMDAPVSISEMMDRVRTDVYTASQGKQVASMLNNSMGGPFYLSGPPNLSTDSRTSSAQPVSANPSTASGESRVVVPQPAEERKYEGEIFTITEKQAVPEGGIQAFYSHIGGNMYYPALARRNNVEGKVFVEFVVETDGTLSSFKVAKGIGSGCDEEAMRVIRDYPFKWQPGSIKGEPVRQRFVLPLIFKFTEDTTPRR